MASTPSKFPAARNFDSPALSIAGFLRNALTNAGVYKKFAVERRLRPTLVRPQISDLRNEMPNRESTANPTIFIPGFILAIL